MTAFVYAIRPICFNWYVKKKYAIDWSVKPDKNALSQRWDGLGHHIAYFIHTNTDIVLLTVFSTMSEVSVYSVYLMVVTGVRSLVNAISSAMEPYFGRIIATGNKERLGNAFKIYDFISSFITATVFIATAILIVPFVSIYTKGVTDADYLRPVFAVILVAAEGVYCLRSPYTCIIFASGHFKQTRNGAFLEAALNIVTSVVLINYCGILGVALGTLVAMLFRTTEYAMYVSNNFIPKYIFIYIKRIIAITLSSFVSLCIYYRVQYYPDNYLQWILLGCVVVVVVFMIVLAVYTIMFSGETKKCLNEMVNLLRRRK